MAITYSDTPDENTLQLASLTPTANAIIIGNGSAWTAGLGATLNVIATGSTAARTLGERAAEVANVLDYGALGNGSTNDHTAVQAAADSLTNGGVLYFPGGKTYKINSEVVFDNDNVSVLMEGATIDASSFRTSEAVASVAEGVFHVQGTLKLTTTLSVSAADKAETLTLTSVTSVAAGDVLHFLAAGGTTDTWYYEQATQVRKSFVTKVLGVSGSVVTIQDPLPFAVDITSADVNVFVWTGVQNVSFHGGKFVGPGFVENRDNGTGEAAISSQYAQGVHVYGTDTEGFQGAVGWFSRTFGFSWSNATLRGLDDSYSTAMVEGQNTGWSGIWGYESASGRFEGLTGYRLRHLVDGARAINVIVSDCDAYNCHRPAYTCHTGCDRWTFDSVRYTGPNGGILWRGFDVEVIGADIYAPNDAEACFYDTTGAADGLGRSIKIIGGKYDSKRSAIVISGNCRFVSITAPDIKGGRESASYPAVSIDSLDTDRIELVGGTIEVMNGGVGVAVTGSARTRDSIRISTHIKGQPGAAITCVGASTTLDTAGCTYEPSGAVTNHVTTSGTFDRLIRGPSLDLQDNTIYAPENVGTWTPILQDSTTAVTTATYTARWTFDPSSRLVNVNGRIVVSDKTGPSGSMRIAFNDLPFTIATNYFGGGLATFASNLSSAAAAMITLRAVSAETFFTLWIWEGAAGPNSLVPSDLSNTTQIYFQASFIAA